MGNYVTRKEWGARPPNPGPGPLDPDQVVGLAFHWPGLEQPLHGREAVEAALRGWQDFHMDSRGWSDIAYQEAVDQDGNVYGLRGLRTQSGANGDTEANERYGAILLIVAPGETPSPLMVAAVQHRVGRFQDIYPRGHRLATHNDVRPEATACPGPIVTAMIRKGAFQPSTPNRVERARVHLDRAVALLDSIPAKDRPQVAKGLDLIREARRTLPPR